MTFAPQTFSNGQYLTATELNQMDANDDHVRAEAGFKTLVTCIKTRAVTGDVAETAISRIYADTTPLTGVTLGTGSKTKTNLDISGLSVGMHELTIKLGDYTEGVERGAMSFQFYKTEDMDYLSVYYAVVDAGDTTVEAKNVTAIGHWASI